MEEKLSFEYAPAPESRALVTIKPKYGHFIGGKFVAGSKHFPTINPATEEVLSQISLAGKADVDAAVKAARKAYTTTWSKNVWQRAWKVPVSHRPHHAGALT